MSGAPVPRMHGLTHVPGGPDPIPGLNGGTGGALEWEDVGTSGTPAGGLLRGWFLAAGGKITSPNNEIGWGGAAIHRGGDTSGISVSGSALLLPGPRAYLLWMGSDSTGNGWPQFGNLVGSATVARLLNKQEGSEGSGAAVLTYGSTARFLRTTTSTQYTTVWQGSGAGNPDYPSSDASLLVLNIGL